MGKDMELWVRVVTQPLGLAGFGLFLLFWFIARAKKNKERVWFSRLAAGAVIFALVGGLFLAYVRTGSLRGACSTNKLMMFIK
jgi:hypothetical protein